MLQHIEQLLIAPASGATAPTLASLEDTLTEGYAKALALEAERWRLERRLGEISKAATTVDAPRDATFTLNLRPPTPDGPLTH